MGWRGGGGVQEFTFLLTLTDFFVAAQGPYPGYGGSATPYPVYPMGGYAPPPMPPGQLEISTRIEKEKQRSSHCCATPQLGVGRGLSMDEER